MLGNAKDVKRIRAGNALEYRCEATMSGYNPLYSSCSVFRYALGGLYLWRLP